jgi:signal peptidase II
LAIIALLLSATAIAVDQAIKMLVTTNLKLNEQVNVINGFFKLFYIQNNGAAFGMLQNQIWLFVLVTLCISAFIIVALFRYQNHEFFSYAASILIVGGGIGNLIDRVVRGYVIDYISISFFPWIFNFADCCVTVGTVFLIIHILFFTERDGKSEKVIRSR